MTHLRSFGKTLSKQEDLQSPTQPSFRVWEHSIDSSRNVEYRRNPKYPNSRATREVSKSRPNNSALHNLPNTSRRLEDNISATRCTQGTTTATCASQALHSQKNTFVKAMAPRQIPASDDIIPGILILSATSPTQFCCATC